MLTLLKLILISMNYTKHILILLNRLNVSILEHDPILYNEKFRKKKLKGTETVPTEIRT